jgi:hypothetical protein
MAISSDSERDVLRELRINGANKVTQRGEREAPSLFDAPVEGFSDSIVKALSMSLGSYHGSIPNCAHETTPAMTLAS